MSDESQHLIVSGVPALGLQDELRKLCQRYGDVKSFTYVPNYSTEKFVDSYHVHFARIQSARFAKRHIDGRAFFGGSLHVCYAPEMESISETRNKLLQRRRDVAKRCISHGNASKIHPPNMGWSCAQNSVGPQIDSDFVTQLEPFVWNGSETTTDPRRLQTAEDLEEVARANYGSPSCDFDWADVGVRKVFIQAVPRKGSDAAAKRCAKPALHFPLHHSTTKSVVAHSSTDVQASCSKSASSVPPILRLVPSQVKGAQKKIVFHPKHEQMDTAPPKIDSGNQSLDETIQSVREKIRAVSVPNVKIALQRDTQENILNTSMTKSRARKT